MEAVAKVVGKLSKDGDAFVLTATVPGRESGKLEDLVLKITGAIDKKIEKARKVQIVGEYRNGSIVLSKAEVVKADTPDAAEMKTIGRVFRSHVHRERTPDGKPAFGYGTLVNGPRDAGSFYRYVAFSPLSESLAGSAVRGAIVQLFGRLRLGRPFTDKAGKTRRNIEVIADDGLTKVLRAPADPFAGMELSTPELDAPEEASDEPGF